MSQGGQSSAEEMFNRGMELWRGKATEEAFEVLRNVYFGLYGPLDRKRQKMAFLSGLNCSSRLRKWPETEAFARDVVARFPRHARGFQYLGEALFRQGRLAEAEQALLKAEALDPEKSEARTLLTLMKSEAAPEPRKKRIRPWPPRQSNFRDARAVIQRYVLKGREPDPFIDADSVFMTMGSCFAENLARKLREEGFTANFEPIGEEVNSTYANRYLLEWVEHGAINKPTEIMESMYGPIVRERFRQALAESNVFVLTLGVAPCFFSEDTGDFAFVPLGSETQREFLQHQNVMRTTTVAENVDNVTQILAAVRRMSRHEPRVVLTVSPVPLAGTTEMESAVTADCISKSTLRVACHEVVTAQRDQGVVYWPSFEIVRWLGAHYGPEHPPAYGDADADTRHVSPWLVEMIIRLFLEHHAAPEDAKAPQLATG